MEEDQRVAVRRMAELQRANVRKRGVDLLAHEKAFWGQGIEFVAGVDEAGRGPLAGPVYAAAVIFPKGRDVPGVNDSKRLTGNERERLEPEILKIALAAHVTSVDAAEIDRINIFQATLVAMRGAITSLSVAPQHVLVDGKFTAGSPFPETAIIDGDARSLSIAAASILAKVARDRHMREMDVQYPGYGFQQHKGYGTRQHLDALRRLGPCAIHRRSFAGVAPEPDNPQRESSALDSLERALRLCASLDELKAVAGIILERKGSLTQRELERLRRVFRNQRAKVGSGAAG
jgi:ribonuclease HII